MAIKNKTHNQTHICFQCQNIVTRYRMIICSKTQAVPSYSRADLQRTPRVCPRCTQHRINPGQLSKSTHEKKPGGWFDSPNVQNVSFGGQLKDGSQRQKVKQWFSGDWGEERNRNCLTTTEFQLTEMKGVLEMGPGDGSRTTWMCLMSLNYTLKNG